MLDDQQRLFIKRNGWMVDHDWEILSCILGEPFLINHLLCYWDGSHLFVCSWPLERWMPIDNQTEQLLSTVAECNKLFWPQSVEIWGPLCISLKSVLPNRFKRLSLKIASDDNVNLQIRFLDYIFPNKSRFFKRTIQAEKQGMICRTTNNLLFASRHHKLLADFIRRHQNLRPFDRAYFSLAPIFACHGEARVFEAILNGESQGLIIVRENLRNTAIATWSFSNWENHTSDFLHRKMIEFYKESDFQYLDFGYSVNKNLLNYKTKWYLNVNNGAPCSYTFVDKQMSLYKGPNYWWTMLYQSDLYDIQEIKKIRLALKSLDDSNSE